MNDSNEGSSSTNQAPAKSSGPEPYDMDLYARQDTARIQMRNPKTLMLTATFVTIHGPQSERFEEASEAMRLRNAGLVRKHKGDDNVPTAAKAASYRQFLVDITDNIEGLVAGGQVQPFSRTLADRYYQDLDICAQLSKEITDRGNF